MILISLLCPFLAYIRAFVVLIGGEDGTSGSARVGSGSGA